MVKKLTTPERKPQKSDSGVIVQGIDNCLVKFSRCCSPVPGDKIIGFITRGYGVSVHRVDCPNVNRSKELGGEAGRWVPVSWADDIKEIYQTVMQISAKDRDGLVVDIATALNSMKVPLRSLNTRNVEDGSALVSVGIGVSDIAQLENIINRLQKIGGIYRIKRQ